MIGRSLLFGLVLLATAAPASALTLSAEDVDAIGRVSVAEAGNQSDAGLAAVIDVILHRAETGTFGLGVQGVINAPNQFEPVTRAGGSWRNLPPPSAEQRIKIATILSLKADGVLGDASRGGLFFQNEAIVRQRAAAGQVKPSMIGFNGLPVTVRVGSHTFYRPAATADPAPASVTVGPPPANRDVREDYAADVEAALGGEPLP